MIINDHAAVAIRSYNQPINEVLAMYTVYFEIALPTHHALLPTLWE